MGAVHQVGIKINVDAKAASTEIPRAARELDALSASTKAAAQAAEKLERGVKPAELSVKQMAQALRTVPMQMTDVVTSLASGSPPLTVLIQQGGQLKDTFGGVMPALKAVGGYVVSMVNPLTLAGAAVAALGAAWYQGSRETQAYSNALIATGNAAGATAGQMASMAREIADGVHTQSAAAASLAEMARSANVGADQLKRYAEVALDWQRVTGTAVTDTAAAFTALKNDPLSATLKLNEGVNYLTESTYEHIRSLTEQGRQQEAARAAQDAFASSLATRSEQMQKNLGYLERSWYAVKGAAAAAWDAMLNIGRPQVKTLAEVNDKIQKLEHLLSVANYKSGDTTRKAIEDSLKKLRTEAAALQGELKAAQDQARANEQLAARTRWDKAGEQYLSRAARMEREVAAARSEGAAAGIQQAEIEERIAQIREKYAEKTKRNDRAAHERAKQLREDLQLLAQSAGLNPNFYEEWDRLNKAFDRGVLSAEALNKAQGELLAKQPVIKAAAEAERKELEAAAKAREALRQKEYERVSAYVKSVESLAKQNESLKEEVELLGLSEREQTRYQQAKLAGVIALKQEQLARLQNEFVHTREQANLEEEIRLLKERNELLEKKALKKLAQETAKEAANSAKEIEKSLTDALLRGFESGKDIARNFRDTLRNMFGTLVLRPAIQAVMAPVAGGLMGMFGSATGAASQGGLGGLGSLGSLVGGDLLGSAGGLLGSAGTMFANGATLAGYGLAPAWQNVVAQWSNGAWGSALATGAGAAAALGGGLLAGRGIGRAISGGYAAWGSGNGAVNLGSAIGAIWGPLGSAIGGAIGGLVNRAFGRRLADTGIEGTFGGDNGFSGRSFQFYRGGWFRSNRTRYSDLDETTRSSLAQPYLAMREQVRQYAQTLALSAQSVDTVTHQIRLSLHGLKPEEAARRIQETLAAAQEALAHSVLGDKNPFTRAGETALQTLERMAQSLSTVNGVFEALGRTLLDVSEYGGDLASQITDMFGQGQAGRTAFSSATAAYMQNFYSSQEQRASLQRSLQRQFESLGLAMPDINASNAREQFRALVDALDLTTEQGRRAFAALMGLQGAFASLTPSADELAESAARAAEAAAQAQRAALDAARSATDAALDALGRFVDAQASQWRKTLQAAQDVAQEARAIFEQAGQSARELRGQTASGQAMQAAQGNATIARMLEQLRRTGALPDGKELGRAIEGARGGLNVNDYASVADYERDQLVLAGKLEEMQGIAGNQLDMAEQQVALARKQVEFWEQQMDHWRRQVELLRGTQTSVGSIAEGVSRLVAAMEAEKRVNETVASTLPGHSSGNTGWGGGGGSGSSSGSGSMGTGLYRTKEELERAIQSLPAGTRMRNYYDPLLGGYRLEKIKDGSRDAKRIDDVADKMQQAAKDSGGNWKRFYDAMQGERAIDLASAWGFTAEDVKRHVEQHGYTLRDGRIVPAYANGGYHTGGWALVGEEGPEFVQFERPARIYNTRETQAMMRGGNATTDAALAQLNALLSQLLTQISGVAVHTGALSSMLGALSANGMGAVRVDVVAARKGVLHGV